MTTYRNERRLAWYFLVALITLFAILVISTRCHAQERVGPAPYVSMTAAGVLDVWSTVDAKNRGFRELNPVLSKGGTTTIVIGKAAATGVIAWSMNKLAKRGHPTLARTFGYVATGVWGAAAIRNARIGR